MITNNQKISNPYSSFTQVQTQQKNCQPKEMPPQKKDEFQKNIALCALGGAILPVITINACKKGRISNIVDSFKNKLPIKDKFKAIWNMFEIESFSQILETTTGGVLGGLMAGLKNSKTKEEKEAKYKEGIFEFLNNMTPTTLVALSAIGLKKIGKEKSIPLKATSILASVAGGMFIANKTSNKINEEIFDKNKKEEEKTKRRFKPSDCLVHTDDLISLAVLTKIPLANKLQVDKILPLIYAKSGYEVGSAKNNEKVK